MSSLRMGGAERVVFDLARVQARSGLRVAVLNLGRSTDVLVPEFQAAGIDVVSLGDKRSPLGRIREMHRVAGGGRVEVIQIHSPFGLLALAPVFPLVRSRVIFTRHGVSPLTRRRWRLPLLWGRHFVHVVTFVSHEGREASAWLQRGWRAKQVVIENGVDLEVETKRPPAEDGRLRIGSVGRLVPLKGQRFLLEAIAALPDSDRSRLSVQLFGDGPDRRDLESLAEALLPEVPVTFHGNVLRRDEIYRRIDILAVTSRTEGLSLAIMEAMARQIPVVATDVGGNPSLVEPGRTGLLVPYGDVTTLAHALRDLINQPELAARLGLGGREFIEERHALQRTAERYLEVYQLATVGDLASSNAAETT